MSYNILASGYRPNLTVFNFDSTSAKIHNVSDSKAPENASWIEPAVGGNGIVYATSEIPNGEVFSLKFQGDDLEITGKRSSNGEEPAHVLALKDGSGIVVGNYTGGQVTFYPTEKDGSLVQETKAKPLEFEFPYTKGSAPNNERQDKPHAHHAIEDSKGQIYVCDLGSDRVWVVVKDGEDGLKVKGYLQAPEGSGPRHAALSPDEKHLYVLTELHHNLFIYDLTKPLPSHPLPDVERNIVPPTIPKSSQPGMSSAEICLNPSIPNVIYCSNRGQLQLDDTAGASGDAVAIVLLNEDGSKIEEIKHVETGCDQIRGMQISKDGKFAAVGGQQAGGVEIYQIGGKRGDDWKLAAKDETLESIVSFIWL